MNLTMGLRGERKQGKPRAAGGRRGFGHARHDREQPAFVLANPAPTEGSGLVAPIILQHNRSRHNALRIMRKIQDNEMSLARPIFHMLAVLSGISLMRKRLENGCIDYPDSAQICQVRTSCAQEASHGNYAVAPAMKSDSPRIRHLTSDLSGLFPTGQGQC